MSLDNETIKNILEIIKNQQLIILEIIKPNSININRKSNEQNYDYNEPNELEKEIDPIISTEPSKRKYTKKSISATMRRKVWDNCIGKKIGEAKCLCCKITDITQLSFNCGHIIAEANGGQIHISNLKPICQNCNSSMGTMNMDDFMKTFQ
jgi:5-methylcytosine-specific restriction endonuclease McrA